ncbi:MAG: malto-oligosyltrehalose trehalohydrolase [Planctomycetia bacterium]|nr:malto-oligosyltrehalose trehalohydrolase [Planctomycetia bacterium]
MAPVIKPFHEVSLRARPHGAFQLADGTVEWSLWAPQARSVEVAIECGGARVARRMAIASDGYFTHTEQRATNDIVRYAFRLDDNDRWLPDPASRWQPDGVHQPSALYCAEDFRWTDADWGGVTMRDLAIYEMHVGTFTEEGTFDAIVPRLGELRDLGVTAIELMPVAQFPGDRNWGYDGVYLYAVQSSYGGPRALQRLVDACHAHGLAVILDVVYNHLGPEGNYLNAFGPYFTDFYRTIWGQAWNYHGADSDPVRRFILDNACMWIRDFHVDGLRLDAVHAIIDLSSKHILAEIGEAAQETSRALERDVVVIAEIGENDPRHLEPCDHGGFGLQGVWSDDFHHCAHALLTGERDGYYFDFGGVEHLAKAFAEGFVYDGCYSPFHRRRHGDSSRDIARERLVTCIQNHDQVGNRAFGERLPALVSPEKVRFAAAAALLAPTTPLLFMGEEYGESEPFQFFCSFGDENLIEAVRRGRREEFAALAFHWKEEVPDPNVVETFVRSRLSWRWEDDPVRAGMRRLYRALLHARRVWPALVDREHTEVSIVSRDGQPARLIIERGSKRELHIVFNLLDGVQPLEESSKSDRVVLLSTAVFRYGGRRQTATSELLPFEVVVKGPIAWKLEG